MAQSEMKDHRIDDFRESAKTWKETAERAIKNSSHLACKKVAAWRRPDMEG